MSKNAEKIEVENCGDCPFMDWASNYCTKTYEDVNDHHISSAPPDGCPLRTADVLVTLRVKE